MDADGSKRSSKGNSTYMEIKSRFLLQVRFSLYIFNFDLS